MSAPWKRIIPALSGLAIGLTSFGRVLYDPTHPHTGIDEGDGDFRFFPGHHHSSDAHKLDRAMIARQNVSLPFTPPDEWMLDSGGYGLLTSHGEYPGTPRDYVQFVAECEKQEGGTLVAAMAEDYPTLWKVKMETDVISHIPLTRERYKEIRAEAEKIGLETPIVPVLHGWAHLDYRKMLESYIEMGLEPGSIVAIGSLKGEKEDSHAPMAKVTPRWLWALLQRLYDVRDDLRFHALGIGKRFLQDDEYGVKLRRLLWSADSASWSMAERYSGGDPNDPMKGAQYAREVEGDRGRTLFDQERQGTLFAS